MKLILIADNEKEKEVLKKDKVEYEDVKQIVIFGEFMKENVIPHDLEFWFGRYNYLIPKTYYLLRRLEKREDEANANR